MKAPDRYAVFGHPIGHSQSPRIHALFAAATQQAMTYGAEDIPPEGFNDAISRFLGSGGRGLNITVPLKELAFLVADTLSPEAGRSKAVNTLLFSPDGHIHGDNTDGRGLVRDLTLNLGIPLKGRRILILGAGGAARGILEPLLKLEPAQVTLANRTNEKARQLAFEFEDLGPLRALAMAALQDQQYDLILNATAASLQGDVPPLPDQILAAGGCCYDLAYGKEPTPFVLWGLQQGAVLSRDGIGMLVEQAAEAFWLWRGIRPDTPSVIATLRGTH
ncbi:MAG: shikimate dehydrogenase [Methylococcaceae bacterium]